MNEKPDNYNYENDEEFLRRASSNSTRALGDTDFEENEPRWGTANFNARTNLLIFIRGVPEPFVFDADSVDELVLGRFDPDTQESPPVDLQNFGGPDKGVSRRHAVIIRKEGQLQIVDEGSHNGTYLNGQRLIPHQPRILRDGDDVRLGHLVLRIKFVRVQANSGADPGNE